MKLSKLIKNVNIKEIKNFIDCEVVDINYDSRKVRKNCVFVCLRGANCDGHSYVDKALDNGACVVVADHELSVPQDVVLLIVEDTRRTLAEISANFFGNPARSLTTIGITGTKGKTTTSFMIKSVLESAGKKCGLIGTIGAIYGDNEIKLENTTPESYELQKHMRKMADFGCEYVVMEASSIGLKTHRLDGFSFDLGIFTNFSRDHIGGAEHKDMEEYLECKSMLFRKCKTGIINIDDDFAEKMTKNSTCTIYTFGKNKNADYQIGNIQPERSGNFLGLRADFSGKISLKRAFVGVPGEFNAYNALAAVSVCDILGINSEAILQGLGNVKIKGRMEPLSFSDDFLMFIDYAHNAVSMKNVLLTLRKYSPRRLVVLFGAGGNRPKIRRYEMGEVAGNLADLSVITSDNPRYEEPLDIIEDIKKGIDKTKGKYVVIVDREQAIEYCIKDARTGDIIVLAGKGHEDYQDIKGVKHKMDERIVVKEIFEKLKK